MLIFLVAIKLVLMYCANKKMLGAFLVVFGPNTNEEFFKKFFILISDFFIAF